jgi:hypothetical protein
MLMKI